MDGNVKTDNGLLGMIVPSQRIREDRGVAKHMVLLNLGFKQRRFLNRGNIFW